MLAGMDSIFGTYEMNLMPPDISSLYQQISIFCFFVVVLLTVSPTSPRFHQLHQSICFSSVIEVDLTTAISSRSDAKAAGANATCPDW
jgi:hypothetical protein